MNDVIGIAWFKDEPTYRRALDIFTDAGNMLLHEKTGRALVKEGGRINVSAHSLRVDINPEAFAEWCNTHGFPTNSQGRIAFVNHMELEYQKTGQGIIID